MGSESKLSHMTCCGLTGNPVGCTVCVHVCVYVYSLACVHVHVHVCVHAYSLVSVRDSCSYPINSKVMHK